MNLILYSHLFHSCGSRETVPLIFRFWKPFESTRTYSLRNKCVRLQVGDRVGGSTYGKLPTSYSLSAAFFILIGSVCLLYTNFNEFNLTLITEILGHSRDQ